MKNSTTVLLCLLFFVSSHGVAQDNQSPTLFRQLNLGQYGRLALGDAFSTKEYLIVKNKDAYFLKDEVFGGAVSIELILNARNKISEIIFEYDTSVVFESKVATYREDLGVPLLSKKKAVWTDGSTRFEIYWQKKDEQHITFSKLIDLKQ